MLIVCGIIVGLLFAGAEYFLLKKDKVFPSLLLGILKYTALINMITLLIMRNLLKIPNVFYASRHAPIYPLKYFCLAFAIGATILFIQCIMDKKLSYEKITEKSSKGAMAGKIISVIFFALGVALFTATVWGKVTFGDITPDQLIINMKSPIAGTSSDIIMTAFEGPVFETISLVVLFAFFVFSKYKLVYHGTGNTKTVFGKTMRAVVAGVMALGIFVGGLSFGIYKFQLLEVFDAYTSDSSYVADNYVSPNTAKITFPEKKRNLIQIYLESVESSYFSEELGGHSKDNLMPELAELSKEGVSFSHNSNTFGGSYQTVGSGWSVAGMVNMEMGIPLKIPMDGNAYGQAGEFLPGAVGLGDILAQQGYKQTLMFGSDAAFGGLSTYFKNHGNFDIIDHKAAQEKGLIPPDYSVWWGYEDEKLFGFAKDEITRLASSGEPFHFEMETADTHFPDGYLSPNVENKYSSQYANVIAYSTKGVVDLVRWIQQQPFYENTTIVLIGDHLSMDQNFFKDFDPAYRRAPFNLFLNTGFTVEHAYNREFAPFDIFPTILAGMGINVDGDKLAMGTNLFSGTPTLLERDGKAVLDDQLNQRSNYYNKEFLAQTGKSTFNNPNIAYK